MAEEELEVDEGSEKKGKSKLIIIIAATALLCLGIGAGGVYFLVGGNDAAEQEPAEPQHVQAIYHRFSEPFIVTVMSGGKQRYLQINVTIKTKDVEVVRLLKAHQPVVKSSLNNLFSAQDLNHMQSAQGRVDLNEEALAVVQTFITSKNEALKVEKVLFTDFVMQ